MVRANASRNPIDPNELPEWLSMNALIAGMFPVMTLLTTRDPAVMEPTNGHFWGVMALATFVWGLLAFPVNWWLVATGLKHGMGSARALGQGGHDSANEPVAVTRSVSARAAAAGITLANLAVGIGPAATFSDRSMRVRG